MIYIANAFSLNMIDKEDLGRIRMASCANPLTLPGVKPELFTSAIGHADTAALLGLPMNRISIKLTDQDVLFVAQLQGPRLPEGTTTLPEGSHFEWVVVTFTFP